MKKKAVSIAAAALGALGGKATARGRTKAQRSSAARKAAKVRWKKKRALDLLSAAQ